MNNELEKSRGNHYTFYGDYTNDRMLYMYYPDPVIKYIFPHGGPNVGSHEEIEIAGAWFLNYPYMGASPRARFGSIEVDCRFESTVRVRCPIPDSPNFKGKVPIDLSFNGVDWTDSGIHFAFYNKPHVEYIYPNSGSAHGGTLVEIHGKNFTGDAVQEEFNCRFSDKHHNKIDKIIPA
jgi:hypothetical protein